VSRPTEQPAPDPFEGLPQLDERICDWVDGCLSERERDRFEAELRISPELRRQLEEYEATVADVREALQAPTVDVPLADRVMAAIASGADVSAAPARRQWPMVAALFAAAALLAVVVWIDDWAGRADTSTVAAVPDSGAAALAEGQAVPPAEDAPAVAEPELVGRIQPEADSAFYLGTEKAQGERGAALERSEEREGAAAPEPRPKQEGGSGGRFGGRVGRQRVVDPSSARAAAPQSKRAAPAGAAGPATGALPAGPKAPMQRARGVAAEVEVLTRLRLELQATARPTLLAWQKAAGDPQRGAPVLEQVRAWFAAEGLQSLEAAPPEASGSAELRPAKLGEVTLTPVSAGADGERAWVLEGSRRDVAVLSGLLATAAREVGGAVERGEESAPDPAAGGGDAKPSAAERRETRVDRLRVVLRVRARR